jgi:hypothetical protein
MAVLQHKEEWCQSCSELLLLPPPPSPPPPLLLLLLLLVQAPDEPLFRAPFSMQETAARTAVLTPCSFGGKTRPCSLSGCKAATSKRSLLMLHALSKLHRRPNSCRAQGLSNSPAATRGANKGPLPAGT